MAVKYTKCMAICPADIQVAYMGVFHSLSPALHSTTCISKLNNDINTY